MILHTKLNVYTNLSHFRGHGQIILGQCSWTVLFLAGACFITALYSVTFIASTVKCRHEGGSTKLLQQKMKEKILLWHRDDFCRKNGVAIIQPVILLTLGNTVSCKEILQISASAQPSRWRLANEFAGGTCDHICCYGASAGMRLPSCVLL